jgi:hypothetical protein
MFGRFGDIVEIVRFYSALTLVLIIRLTPPRRPIDRDAGGSGNLPVSIAPDMAFLSFDHQVWTMGPSAGRCMVI